MRQAIEEGFILDVLKHYTTYKTYHRLVKAIADDPKVPKKEAAKSLARFMSLHPHNIAQKTEVIIEHFRQHVRKRIGGRAKAMLITQSRLHAVRYRQQFEVYLKEKGYNAEDVQESFQPYYEQTTVADQADPQQLYELQHKLDSSQVYLQSEVDAFAKIFYAPNAKKAATDQAQLVKHLDPAVDRFKALDDDAREEFRGSLTAYVRLYAFLSQVMPFTDADLEKLYSFGRYLQNKLPRESTGKGIKLDGDVALRYYRLQKISEGDLLLEPHHPIGLKGPTEVGTAKSKEEQVELSKLIDLLNERFGMGLTAADQPIFDGMLIEAKSSAEVIQRAKVNEPDNFELSMRSFFQDLMVGRLERHEEIVTRYLNDPLFKELLDRELARRAYEEIRGGPSDQNRGS